MAFIDNRLMAVEMALPTNASAMTTTMNSSSGPAPMRKSCSRRKCQPFIYDPDRPTNAVALMTPPITTSMRTNETTNAYTPEIAPPINVTSSTFKKPPKSRPIIWNRRLRRHPAEKLSYRVARRVAACRKVPIAMLTAMVKIDIAAPEAIAVATLTALPAVRPVKSMYKEPGKTTCSTSAMTNPRERDTKNARPPVESTLP